MTAPITANEIATLQPVKESKLRWPERVHQIQHRFWHCLEPRHDIHQYREEAPQNNDDDLWPVSDSQPQNDEWCERHLWNRLQSEQDRIKQPPRRTCERDD